MNDSNHEHLWYLNQKARVKNARAGATLIWSNGEGASYPEMGYYIIWNETQVDSSLTLVGQFMGAGDARTQLNIENWITQYGKRG